MAYEQVQKQSASVVPVQKKRSGFAPPVTRVQAKDDTAGEQEQMPLGSTPATDANWLMKHPLFKGNQFLQRVVAPESESESKESEESIAQRETVQRQEEGDESGTPSSLPVQAKLTIGEAGDKYEQEADRLAADVVQRIHAPESKKGGEGEIQRLELGEEEEVRHKSDGGTLQRVEISQLNLKSAGGNPGEASAELEGAIQAARGSGQPLAESVREPMEREFGADFSRVRVHTDASADEMNQSIQAKAFTTGQDVFFRQGAYDPGSRGGQELLAHELTHVVQQNGGNTSMSIPMTGSTLIGKKKQENAPWIQLKKGDKHIGTLTEKRTVKLIGKQDEFDVAEAFKEVFEGQLVTFIEGEDKKATNVELLKVLGDKREDKPPSKLTEEQLNLIREIINDKTRTRREIAELLKPRVVDEKKVPSRYTYEPEEGGVHIGLALIDHQSRLPAYTKIATEEKGNWKMKTVGRSESHEWQNADGVYDFVIQPRNPQRLRMIRRQQGGAGHSSFGATVLMAGEIKFHDGELIEWSTRSGHFMPSEALTRVTILPQSKHIGFTSLKNEKNQKTEQESQKEEEKTNGKEQVKQTDKWEEQLVEIIKGVKEKYKKEIEEKNKQPRRPQVAVENFILNTEEVRKFLEEQKKNGKVISNNQVKRYIN